MGLIYRVLVEVAAWWVVVVANWEKIDKTVAIIYHAQIAILLICLIIQIVVATLISIYSLAIIDAKIMNKTIHTTTLIRHLLVIFPLLHFFSHNLRLTTNPHHPNTSIRFQ